MGQWPSYGDGAQGWAKRFAATLADTESRRFIQTYALSTILHQDPRYFPSGKRALIARVWYSTTRVVVTKNDNGSYKGQLKTVSIRADIDIIPNRDKSAETHPDFRVVTQGVEIGDPWGSLLELSLGIAGKSVIPV